MEKNDPKYRRFYKAEQSKVFKNILGIFNLREKAVFDIGCSYGEHLVHFGEGSMGLTLEKVEVRYAKEHGFNVQLGNIEEGFSAKKKFDVIFANNIFEHLNAPHSFLINAHRYIKDDGLLILGVPCIPKIESLLKITKFRGALHEAHINYFTRTTLKLTVECAGWNIHYIRGFRIKNKIIDTFLNPIYPHFYVIATKIKDFEYSESRERELRGYGDS